MALIGGLRGRVTFAGHRAQAELEQEMGSWRQEAMNLSARVNQVCVFSLNKGHGISAANLVAATARPSTRVFTLATPVVRTSGLQVESELGAAQAAAAAAESRAVELERALQHVAREKDAMAVARDDAVAQYNQLRQSTIQLVNFKNVRPGGGA